MTPRFVYSFCIKAISALARSTRVGALRRVGTNWCFVFTSSCSKVPTSQLFHVEITKQFINSKNFNLSGIPTGITLK